MRYTNTIAHGKVMGKVAALAAIPMVLAYASCCRDHLYYETSLQPNVQLNIDWSRTAFSPSHPSYDPDNPLNGVSIFAYDAATQRLVAEFPPDANWSTPQLRLAPGTYDLVIINDSRYELPTINFSTELPFEDFVASITPDSPGLVSSSYPEYLTSAAVRNVTVKPVEEVYEYYRPDASHNSYVMQEIDVVERAVTKRINIKVNVNGINYCKRMLPSYMTGLSMAANLVTRLPEREKVTYAFNLNNRQFKNSTRTEAVLSQTFNSFSFNEDNLREGTRFDITLNFLLVNNETYTVTADVTPQLEKWLEEHTIDCDLDLDIDITLDVTLPAVEPAEPDPPQPQGGMNPDTDPWNDIKQDVIL